MSTELESAVRAFLYIRLGRFWDTMPYDWLDMPVEYLDDMHVFPIPDDVIDAYHATRRDPLARERDAGVYDQPWPVSPGPLSVRRWTRRGAGWRVSAELGNGLS